MPKVGNPLEWNCKQCIDFYFRKYQQIDKLNNITTIQTTCSSDVNKIWSSLENIKHHAELKNTEADITIHQEREKSKTANMSKPQTSSKKMCTKRTAGNQNY